MVPGTVPGTNKEYETFDFVSEKGIYCGKTDTHGRGQDLRMGGEED